MIKELDTVVLTHDIAMRSLKNGDIGAVVHVSSEQKHYEVEFCDGIGENVSVVEPFAGRYSIFHG